MSFDTDIVLGALLVATWANSVWGHKFMVKTLNQLQAAYYYRHFKHDNWMLKFLVSSVIAIDTVAMIANYTSVYLFDPLYIFATGIVAALVQGFLAARTRNKFITLILFFFITAALGAAFAGGITIAIFPEYTNREKATIPATTWMITGVVADISIASALLFKLMKAKSSFVGTRRFLANKESNGWCLGPPLSIRGSHTPVPHWHRLLFKPRLLYYPVGVVSQNLKLANLNSRKGADGGPSSGVNVDASGERENQGRSECGDEYRSIHGRSGTVFYRLIQTQRELFLWFNLYHGDTDAESHSGQGLPGDTPAAEIEMTEKHPAYQGNWTVNPRLQPSTASAPANDLLLFPKVGHGYNRGYRKVNPHPYPSNPYPARVGYKTRAGKPAVPQPPAGRLTRCPTRRVYLPG
ncbi:hypothetical protein B0H14DRAFT_2598164 [Mycena olivaceomarginata]|nr:hypothetical protein B0H14DRAFT_2598164 [Mycena olivaceomarginata]